MREWEVIVHFKEQREPTTYSFLGSEEEAWRDPYLSFPIGAIQKVIVQPANPE